MHVCIQQDEFHLVKPNEGPGAFYVGNGWNLSGGISGPSLIGRLFIHASLVRDIYSLLRTADQGFSYTLFQAAGSGRSGPLFWTFTPRQSADHAVWCKSGHGTWEVHDYNCSDRTVLRARYSGTNIIYPRSFNTLRMTIVDPGRGMEVSTESLAGRYSRIKVYRIARVIWHAGDITQESCQDDRGSVGGDSHGAIWWLGRYESRCSCLRARLALWNPRSS